ncbi:hypothetical protein SAMN05443543_1115 [Flavobacterium flevense]|nr:hypothetical protein SAMN05443543_1115 [Flavobacterium flevense]
MAYPSFFSSTFFIFVFLITKLIINSLKNTPNVNNTFSSATRSF